MRKLPMIAALTAFGVSTSGCALLAGAGLGVLAADEAIEDDGQIDPLEDVAEEVDDDIY